MAASTDVDVRARRTMESEREAYRVRHTEILAIAVCHSQEVEILVDGIRQSE